jgi:hypothetical protein
LVEHCSAVAPGAPAHERLSLAATIDPYTPLAELRERERVIWSEVERGWLVLRVDDVVDAFADPRLPADRVRPLIAALDPDRRQTVGPVLQLMADWMVVRDPPVHTRPRRRATAAFRPQRIMAMERHISGLVDDLLDELGPPS